MSARFLTNKQCEIWCERYRSDNECEYYSDKPLCWWAGRALPRLLGITWARCKMIAIHMPSTTLSDREVWNYTSWKRRPQNHKKQKNITLKFSLRRLYYTDEKNKHKYATSSLLWQRHVIPVGIPLVQDAEDVSGIALWMSADLNNIGMSVCQISPMMKTMSIIIQRRVASKAGCHVVMIFQK